MKFIRGVLLVGLLGVQAPAQTMGRLTLDERFGRALFSHCAFTVYYFEPHMPKVDRVELNCTPLAGLPNQETMSATRTLTAEESNRVARLANESDLYDGGHTGDFTRNGSEGAAKRLYVRCCTEGSHVVLVVTGNLTFQSGSRRELLQLLNQWRTPLREQFLKRKR